MPIAWRIALLGLLLSSCAAHRNAGDIAVLSTLINYKTGAQIRGEGAHTDRGARLPFEASLIESSTLKDGKTYGGIGSGPGLPEWVDLTWTEDFRPQLSTEQWFALDPAGRKARIDELQRMPVKSARVAVRSRVPASVIEELEQSPLDPESKTQPLKSLWLYFIWTRDGVKLRWQVYKGCCTVIHEGGDIVR